MTQVVSKPDMLDRELNPTHDISRDADGGYLLTPVEGEEQPEKRKGLKKPLVSTMK